MENVATAPAGARGAEGPQKAGANPEEEGGDVEEDSHHHKRQGGDFAGLTAESESGDPAAGLLASTSSVSSESVQARGEGDEGEGGEDGSGEASTTRWPGLEGAAEGGEAESLVEESLS